MMIDDSLSGEHYCAELADAPAQQRVLTDAEAPRGVIWAEPEPLAHVRVETARPVEGLPPVEDVARRIKAVLEVRPQAAFQRTERTGRPGEPLNEIRAGVDARQPGSEPVGTRATVAVGEREYASYRVLDGQRACSDRADPGRRQNAHATVGRGGSARDSTRRVG